MKPKSDLLLIPHKKIFNYIYHVINESVIFNLLWFFFVYLLMGNGVVNKLVPFDTINSCIIRHPQKIMYFFLSLSFPSPMEINIYSLLGWNRQRNQLGAGWLLYVLLIFLRLSQCLWSLILLIGNKSSNKGTIIKGGLIQ